MPKSIFVCQECGGNSPKWSGKCPSCGSWNTLLEETSTTGQKSAHKPAIVSKLSEINNTSAFKRLNSHIDELNQVMGGGIVPSSVILLAGEPGVGKSTLLLQLATKIAKQKKVLYVSGEESLQQIKSRADRLGSEAENLDLLPETDIDVVAATIESSGYDFAIVDSIQTMQTDSIGAAAGTVSQITASTHILQKLAKKSTTAILVVGHVTKEGNIAGPKILEHLVDVVLHLEGERFGSFKMLRCDKNRYGSTREVGIFEMQDKGLLPVANPSAKFLDERQVTAGSVVFTAVEGTRAILVEVQALVNTSPFGYPKRTSAGFDLNRLNLLVAVLQQRAGIKLADKDVYINVVGGMKLVEPAADLAVALAIASAATGKVMPADTVVYGEIGLSGEVRSVSDWQKRVKEAKKMDFKHAIAPKSSTGFIHPVKSLRSAVEKAFK